MPRNTYLPRAIHLISVATLMAACTGALAQPGYLDSAAADSVARNDFGECWHTGSFTPGKAIIGCDGKAAQPAPEPVSQAPAPVPPKPVERQLERVTLDAETYFEFDKAKLKPGAVDKLDELIEALKESESVSQILVTGHADRIGDDAYNQKLSEARANSVRDYLVERTNMADRITAVGKGETAPLVKCETQPFKALVKCLQPNRRVDVDATVMDHE